MRGLLFLALVLIVFSVLFVSTSFAQTEEITITTYYPSPYGSYKLLQVGQALSVGDVNGDGDYDNEDFLHDASGAPATGTLAVAKEIRVGSSGASLACNTTNAGAIRYNHPSIEFCNGTDWTLLAANENGLADFKRNQGIEEFPDYIQCTNVSATPDAQFIVPLAQVLYATTPAPTHAASVEYAASTGPNSHLAVIYSKDTGARLSWYFKLASGTIYSPPTSYFDCPASIDLTTYNPVAR